MVLKSIQVTARKRVISELSHINKDFSFLASTENHFMSQEVSFSMPPWAAVWTRRKDHSAGLTAQ